MIITKDNYYIYDQRSAEDFLKENFDEWQIQDFKKFLCEDYLLLQEDKAKLIEDYKRESEFFSEQLLELQNELLDLADSLETGRGGTKIQYADRIRKIVNQY